MPIVIRTPPLSKNRIASIIFTLLPGVLGHDRHSHRFMPPTVAAYRPFGPATEGILTIAWRYRLSERAVRHGLAAQAAEVWFQCLNGVSKSEGKIPRTPGGFGFPVVFLMFAGFCLGGKVEDCFSLMK